MRRRPIRRKRRFPPPEYIKPRKLKKLVTKTEDFLYFSGHVIKEVAQQLPSKIVLCPMLQQMLDLPGCARRKFLLEETYCKRCSLFQEDSAAEELKRIIEKWEEDQEPEP